MTILFISPVERTSPQGRHNQPYTYVDETTKELKQGKTMRVSRAGSAGYTISFTADFANLKYRTGLDQTIENPFYGQDPSFQIPEVITKNNTITLQNYYEILDNVPLDTYHNRMTGGGIFRFTNKTSLDTPTSFVEKFNVTLYDRANRFDDTTPRGRMSIQLLKNHPSIAHSKNDINSTIHSFYVSEENEALIEKQKKQDIIDQSTYEKINLLNGSNEFLSYKVVSMCLYNDNKPALQGQANPELVKRQLNTYLSEGKHQMKNVSSFLNLIELMKTDKSRFDTKYLIQQAYNTGALQIKDGYLVWPSKVNVPNLYKFSDVKVFENLILNEMLSLDASSDLSNSYKDLRDEVKSKGGRIE